MRVLSVRLRKPDMLEKPMPTKRYVSLSALSDIFCRVGDNVLPLPEILELPIVRHLRTHLSDGSILHLRATRVEPLGDRFRAERFVSAPYHAQYRPSLFAHPVHFGVAEDGPGSSAGVPLQGKLYGVLEVASIPEEIRICLTASSLQHKRAVHAASKTCATVDHIQLIVGIHLPQM